MSDLTHAKDAAEAVDAIAALMRGRRTLAVTGAGISTDAGIPDYRGAGTTPVEPVDYDQFVTDPVWYRWVWARNHATWRLLDPLTPTPGHTALARLEEAGLVTGVATQNVDRLHSRAGQRTVWELHGNWERLVCTSCGAVASLGDSVRVDGDPVPTCPSCASQMRPDIVMYGESLDQDVIEAAVTAISRASVLIVAGTSLVVYPAAGLINYFSGDHLVLMNATPTSADAHADLIVREPVARTFDLVMDKLHEDGVVSS